MNNKLKVNIRDTTRILRQLDEQSLLLIDSGARLLIARQRMEEEKKANRQLQEV